MRKSRFTEQQIIGFLKQAESGLPVKEVCRQGGFSEPAFFIHTKLFAGLHTRVQPLARLIHRRARPSKVVDSTQSMIWAGSCPPALSTPSTGSQARANRV